jgi:glycosyltransferase involved in cell wall biosynthesis
VRIAYVTETWLPSVNGVVTRLVATVRELSALGHQVLVIAPTVGGAPNGTEPAGATVRHVPSVGIPFIYGGQQWGLPLPRVARALDAFAPEVVHAVSPVLLGWAGVLFARFRDVPLVCSYHTHVARYAQFYHLGFAERPVWALVRRAHRHAHVNLASSEATRDELQSQGVPDVSVWRGAVDLNLFHPEHASEDMRRRLTGGHPERPLCLYVGRMAAEKGVDRLVPLAAHGGQHLAMVGDGPARSALEETFAGTWTTFTGPLAGLELAAAYASADVFVFPSTTDTLGLVLLEAMASGLPVVAARTPVSADLVRRAPAGGLFEASDGAGLVAAVRHRLDAPVDREHVAAAARAQSVSWRVATDELLATYARAVARARSRAAA